MSTTPEIAAALVALRYDRTRPAPHRTGTVWGEMLPTPTDPPPHPEPRTSPPPLPRQKSAETRTITLRPGSFAKSL